MRKRLVITGLPCPREPWEELLGPVPGQRIISMHEVLEHTQSADPREMSRYITAQLESERPLSIVAHDLGVPLTLLALLRLKKRGIEWDPRLTLFNGAFRNVSLLRARQPLRVQWTRTKKVIREVQAQGGAVDPDLVPHAPRIRALYRRLIVHRLVDKLASRVGLDYLGRFPKRAGLRVQTQILASPNDPYLPMEAMEQLESDLEAKRLVRIEYGHFPYSIAGEKIRPLIEEFERAH